MSTNNIISVMRRRSQYGFQNANSTTGSVTVSVELRAPLYHFHYYYYQPDGQPGCGELCRHLHGYNSHNYNNKTPSESLATHSQRNADLEQCYVWRKRPVTHSQINGN